MNSRSILISSFFLPPIFAGCALIDGLKDGKFCLVAGDVDPTNEAFSSPPNCGRTGDDSFISATYLTSLLTGETRTIPLTVVERGATLSDDEVELGFQMSGAGFSVTFGSVTGREETTIGGDSAVLTKSSRGSPRRAKG